MASQISDHKTLIMAQHFGIKYPCNHCDYVASQKCNLRTHLKSKHKLAYCYHCNEYFNENEGLSHVCKQY